MAPPYDDPTPPDRPIRLNLVDLDLDELDARLEAVRQGGRTIWPCRANGSSPSTSTRA
ncbi:MAG: hypothetical protein ACK5RL_13550 [Acidimicrobiales bacterium]